MPFRHLPGYVEQEFEAYLKCGRLVHGFLRQRCTACHAERLVAGLSFHGMVRDSGQTRFEDWLSQSTPRMSNTAPQLTSNGER